MPSALIAGFRANSGIQSTLSDTFYGINSGKEGQDRSPPRHKAQSNKPVHIGGIKGGTQLFTITEEAGGEDPRDAPYSQDS